MQQEETLEGSVLQIEEEKEFHSEGVPQNYQKLRILVYKGSLKDKKIEVENGMVASSNSQKYKVGDKLQIIRTLDAEGNEIFFISDYVRRSELFVVFAIFAVLVVVVGGVWGAASLAGMAFSFLVIFQFILPQIIAGVDPVFIAIVGSCFIVPVTFTLSHGFKLKTLIAGISTIMTLVIVGFTAVIFVSFVHLSGFSAEEAGFLQFDLGNLINMRGVLLAGIIIASLGVLDDITIAQASVVQELKEANKSYGLAELFKKGMNVGRDHIASLVNTLILVYTGASLPLLLLFINNPLPFGELINYEIIAEEIVRTLVGSIGLILAVPITTFIAAYKFARKTQK
jgi:uncharacterized membrane protein